jgi:25S rRNA (adenine2142-N1)-methyltransferase
MKKKHTISHGRPPRLHRSKTGISSKATRTIIRSHHNLQKAHAQALKAGDESRADDIKKEIEERGGLKLYQQASIIGQSSSRGGDSSRILMQWLDDDDTEVRNSQRYKMLEVGALSRSNVCSRSGLFDVTRIDLHSQDPQIEQQDFMERPLPAVHQERFDIISLSLVLNYVPDAAGKGDMLRRTCQFLRHTRDEASRVFPALFLVLPAPCIDNSRYMTEELLDMIMESLGYAKLRQKISKKLVYSLWKYEPNSEKQFGRKTVMKKEINPGKGRNNFAIVLR